MNLFYVYDINMVCLVGQMICKLCRECILLCNGFLNGNNMYFGQLGGFLYIICFNDRIIFVRICEVGIYDLIVKLCVFIVFEINLGIYFG